MDVVYNRYTPINIDTPMLKQTVPLLCLTTPDNSDEAQYGKPAFVVAHCNRLRL